MASAAGRPAAVSCGCSARHAAARVARGGDGTRVCNTAAGTCARTHTHTRVMPGQCSPHGQPPANGGGRGVDGLARTATQGTSSLLLVEQWPWPHTHAPETGPQLLPITHQSSRRVRVWRVAAAPPGIRTTPSWCCCRAPPGTKNTLHVWCTVVRGWGKVVPKKGGVWRGGHVRLVVRGKAARSIKGLAPQVRHRPRCSAAGHVASHLDAQVECDEAGELGVVRLQVKHSHQLASAPAVPILSLRLCSLPPRPVDQAALRQSPLTSCSTTSHQLRLFSRILPTPTLFLSVERARGKAAAAVRSLSFISRLVLVLEAEQAARASLDLMDWPTAPTEPERHCHCHNI